MVAVSVWLEPMKFVSAAGVSAREVAVPLEVHVLIAAVCSSLASRTPLLIVSTHASITSVPTTALL